MEPFAVALQLNILHLTGKPEESIDFLIKPG